jgi:hypothetical protein
VSRKVIAVTVAAAVAAALAASVLAFRANRPTDSAGHHPVGMACSDATVDGTPLSYEREQDFIKRSVPVTLYRSAGTYWVVFPSTGGSDHSFAKPDASWVPDSSAAARTTCSAYLVAPSPGTSS